MSDPQTKPAKFSIWGLTIRFLKLGLPYKGRILATILVCLVASGAKSAQIFIMKPLIDNARGLGKAVPADKIAEKAPDWAQQLFRRAAASR